MSSLRRDFLRLASAGVIATATGTQPRAPAEITPPRIHDPNAVFDVKVYGARGNGITIDTPAINKAIAAANAGGGGTVRFPPGTYACYSIHLRAMWCSILNRE